MLLRKKSTLQSSMMMLSRLPAMAMPSARMVSLKVGELGSWPSEWK
jgi:hypothetical protein